MLEEQNKYSPLRVVDAERGAMLEPGQLGVVLAPAGTGKTTCLVQIGLDHLLHGRRVAHVALDQSVDRVRDWYDEGLKELAEVWAPLDFTIENRIDMERRRHIFSYQHYTFTPDHFARQIDLMATHQGFRPEVIIVDGYDFAHATREDVAELKAMAGERRASLWVAARASGTIEPGTEGLPAPCDDLGNLIDVALYIAVTETDAHLHVLWNRMGKTGQSARLDPRTLLIKA
jgi:hypothetical protein